MKMGDPAEVWLDAWCDICDRMPNDGRMWAPDNPFDQCVECGRGPVKYVPASEPLEERASYEAELRRKELAAAELVAQLKDTRELLDTLYDPRVSYQCESWDRNQSPIPVGRASNHHAALIAKHAKPEAEADHD